MKESPEPSRGRKEAEYYITKCSPKDYKGMKLFCDNLKTTLYESFDFIDQQSAQIERYKAAINLALTLEDVESIKNILSPGLRKECNEKQSN